MARNWRSMDLRRLEKLLVERWDQVAEDYYSQVHPTTRNFDAVIDAHLPHYLDRLDLDGYVLDIGGGRGRVAQLLAEPAKATVVGDISIRMMRAAGLEIGEASTYVQMSAFHCPLRGGAFKAVISVLGDSFARHEAFVEFRRILRSGGRLVLAAPSAAWGRTLRRAAGIDVDETVLCSRGHGEVRVPSFLYDENELEARLSRAGFEVLEVRSFDAVGVVRDAKELSQHVVVASRALNLPPVNVPLITIALALKR